MTLAQLKRNLKITTIMALLSLYGIGAFLLGKSQNLGNLLKVKGTTTQNEPNSPVESPVPFADTQSQTVIASYVRLCSNTIDGFQIAYPKDWFTTYNTEDQKCLFYAPYSYVLPRDTIGFQIPIKIEIISIETWPTVSRFYENPNDLVNIISGQNIQLGIYPVYKITAQATGTGLQTRGQAAVYYLIFASGKPMVVTYTQLTDQNNAQEQILILEEMIKSLKFF